MRATNDDQIKKTIVVVIAPGAAEVRSEVVARTTAQNARKGAITVIMIEIAGASKICNEDVNETVVVVVAPGATTERRHVADNTAHVCGCHFSEPAIAIVPIQRVRCRHARAVHDKQIKVTVVIVIDPGGTDRVFAVGYDGARRDAREGAVFVVLIEMVLLVCLTISPHGHKKIRPSVPVEVAPHCTITILILF